MSDEGVKLKAGIAGASAELSLSDKVLAVLVPRRIAKARVAGAIADEVIDRIRSGTASETDADYVKTLLGDAEAKVLRQQQIASRAVDILAEMPTVPQLPPMSESHDAAAKPRVTTADWLSRFWDDAGLVSDDELQEIYAHILASEARAPGTCSLRTLRVLRYMDRQTADAFARLLPLVMDSQWVPEHLDLAKSFGQKVTYDLILELADAGLIESHEVAWGPDQHEDPVFLRYGTHVLRVRTWRSSANARIRVYHLTRAGNELARVAVITRTSELFFAIGRWIRAMVGLEPANFTWAEMQADGRFESIKAWKPLPEEPKPEPPKAEGTKPDSGPPTASSG